MDDIEVEVTECGNSIVTLACTNVTISGGCLPVGDYVLRPELTAASGGLQAQINGISLGNVTTGSLYPNYNPNNYVHSGNLYETGLKLLSLSGDFLSHKANDLTGIYISGGESIVGRILFTGLGGLQISQSGQIIVFSGGAGGSTINTGSLTGEFISRFESGNILDSTVVRTTGSQNISGVKTFFNDTFISGRLLLNLIDNGPLRGLILRNDITDLVNITPAEQYLSNADATSFVDIKFGQLWNSVDSTLNWLTKELSGNWSTNTLPIQSGHIINKYYLDQRTGNLIGRWESGRFYGVENINNYLSSGNTGRFYDIININNYATSGNLYSTGEFLKNIIDTVSGNLTSTGISILSSCSQVKVTGSLTIVSPVFTGMGNVTVYQSGTSTVVVSGNVDNLATTSNLTETGINILNRITNLVTGISVSGGAAMTGLFNFNPGTNITFTQIGLTGITIASAGGSATLPSNLVTGNGLENYIPKFSVNGTGLNNSLIVESGGYLTNFLSGSLYTLKNFNIISSGITGLVISGTNTTINNTLNIGAFSFQTNAGQVTAFELPIVTGAVSGQEQSYAFNIGGKQLLKIYAEYDGYSGIQNTRIILGTGQNDRVNINAGAAGAAPNIHSLTIPVTQNIYGGTATLPGTPSGWWTVLVSGVTARIPYYF